MDKIKLVGSRFALIRERDGAGDSGPMMGAFDRTEGKFVGEEFEIIVGHSIRCGSPYARTMQWQDYWTTTPVTEIIEKADDDTWAKVRTGNSIYMVKAV